MSFFGVGEGQAELRSLLAGWKEQRRQKSVDPGLAWTRIRGPETLPQMIWELRCDRSKEARDVLPELKSTPWFKRASRLAKRTELGVWREQGRRRKARASAGGFLFANYYSALQGRLEPALSIRREASRERKRQGIPSGALLRNVWSDTPGEGPSFVWEVEYPELALEVQRQERLVTESDAFQALITRMRSNLRRFESGAWKRCCTSESAHRKEGSSPDKDLNAPSSLLPEESTPR